MKKVAFWDADRAVWYTTNYRLDIQEGNHLSFSKKKLFMFKQNVNGFKKDTIYEI
jgi:hypothetical protein